jgi:hypothetical protein
MRLCACTFRRLAILGAALAATGCGGGIWLGIGDDPDDPPSVALVSDVDAAPPGGLVRLTAAASDDFGVDHVAFFRVDPTTGGATLLARVAGPPYRLDVAMPDTSAAAVEFFARAVDDVGQVGDSDVVSVAVLP